MPAANGFSHCFRTGVAHLRQGFERFGIIVVAGENEIAGRRRQFWCSFEQARVISLHRIEALDQRVGEFRIACESHHAANIGDAFFRIRQSVFLLVGDHLDAMFDIA